MRPTRITVLTAIGLLLSAPLALAEPLAPGATLAELRLPDQHGEQRSVGADTKAVLFSPAGTVVVGALNPSGRFCNSIAMSPSKPSKRSTLTVIGKAPPFQTDGAVGVKFTVKLGRGRRSVSR